MELESLLYFSLLMLCITYIFSYWRLGVTHPTILFFSFVLFYLPFKYFLVKMGNFDYAYYPNVIGKLATSNAIELGAVVLVVYLFLSAALHLVFRLTRVPVPIFSAEVRIPMVAVSVWLGLLFLVAFITVESFDSLLGGLKFREFTSQRGMGYFSIAYSAIVLVALSQAIDARKHRVFWALFFFHGAFSVLAGQTGPMVNMALFSLVFLFLVRRYAPINLLVGPAIVVPILALFHGIIRVRGDLLSGINFLMQSLQEGDEVFRFVVTNLIERIDQLEEFSVLSSAVISGALETDPLWPFQLFLQFVPRALWMDKPYFFNSQMMSIFYPDILADNVTFNFLAIGEFIYSFGLSGIAIAALLTGYLLYIIDVYVKNSKGSSGISLFFLLIPYYILNGGFHVGWMNTPILPTGAITLILLFVIGKLKLVRSNYISHPVNKLPDFSQNFSEVSKK